MVLPDQFVFDGKFAVQIVGYEYFDSGEDYDYDFLNIYYDMTALDDSFRTIKRIYWSATQSDTELEDDPSSSLKYDNGDHTDEEKLEAAMRLPCPIKKFSGRVILFTCSANAV